MANSNELLFEAPLILDSESVSLHCDQKGTRLRYGIWFYTVQQINNLRSIDRA